jgi:hypothetical protein
MTKGTVIEATTPLILWSYGQPTFSELDRFYLCHSL